MRCLLWKSLLLLASIGYLVPVIDASGESVFAAVEQDDGAAIHQALDGGDDIEAIGQGGQTPLVHAVLTGKLNAVKALLEKGADTFATEKDGYNVIHAAAFQGRSEILEILATHNNGELDLTHLHRDGYYPIHRACWGRHERHARTVEVFLKHGVKYDIESISGKTCTEMTRNEDTLAVLFKAAERQAGENEL